MYGFDVPKSGYLSASSGSAGGVRPVTKISKLMCLKDAKGYWFYGKISSVLPTDVWAYPGCDGGSCTGRAQLDCGDYVCDKDGCKKQMERPVEKYKLMLEVKDKDGSTVVVFFDELCRQILGKSAIELRSEMDEADETPRKILDLEGKCYLFKISDYSCVNDGARDWYIGSVCDDPSTIVEYAQDDEYSSEEDSDDENLDLLLGNVIQGDSNASVDAPQIADGDNGLTPSSKHR